mgnify:CR=1 FL=1
MPEHRHRPSPGEASSKTATQMVSSSRREQIRQLPILARRYFATLRGDAGSLALLLLQAPLIGWFCALVWGSVEEDTPSLYFVMCLSALWFGCINACREIVKERAIIERERFFGLNIIAYVGSKVWVLAGIAAVQVVALDLVVEWHLNLKGSMGVQLLSLWLASLAGIGLGLVVSALASTQERAVFAVPLLILPQILFSEIAIPKDAFSDAVSIAEKVMPVRWGYRVFVDLADKDGNLLAVLLGLLAQVGFAAALIGVTWLVLLRRRDPV